jgi:hypothetical protein
MNSKYNIILDEYLNDSRIKILYKIKGKKDFNRIINFLFPNGAPIKWLSVWTETQKRNAKGFIYSRKLRKNTIYSCKLFTKRGKDNIDSVIGESISNEKIFDLLEKFK